MVRPTDLQDNLSKTQAVERVFQSMRQQPDNEQSNFALQVQQKAMREKESVEEMEDQHQIEMKTSLEKKREREKQEEREKRKKKEKEEKIGKTGDYLIDITI